MITEQNGYGSVVPKQWNVDYCKALIVITRCRKAQIRGGVAELSNALLSPLYYS